MNVSFGLSLSTSAARGADPVRDAQRAESLGFDFLTVSDHPMGTHPTFETWTLLTWVAAHTERIGLVTNVLGLPYRPPAIVAKMAESLDRLSGGRLTLGLGSGGNDQAIHALGLAERTPGEKLEALREAIEIMRGLWHEQTLTYEGTYFQTDDARIEPKADRVIPIWLGTYRPKALQLTGRLADGWSPSLPYAPLDEAKQMRERVLQAARAAGRSPEAITCNYNFGIHIGGRATDDRVVAGSIDQVVERIVSFVRAGFTSLSFWPLGDEAEQVPRLAQEVVPAVRSAVASTAGTE